VLVYDAGLREVIMMRWGLGLVCAALLLGAGLRAQSGAPASGEWPTYGGDLGHTRYSPLAQITPANFNKLEIAWRFRTDQLGPRPEYQFESTPLMVGGIVYSTAGTRRAVVAVDGKTGELIWMHSEQEGARGGNAPRQLSGRGLSYWTDGRDDKRILYVTPGYRLVALEAATGRLVRGFGKDGVVDLKADFDQEIDLVAARVGLHSTPTIVFLGDRDRTVHPRNGEDVIARSAHQQNGNAGRSSSEPGRAPGGLDYTRTVHRDPAGRVLLEHWLVHRGGHAWFGGSQAGSYTDPRGPDASAEMVRFFLDT
jgi:hypothetical protein